MLTGLQRRTEVVSGPITPKTIARPFLLMIIGETQGLPHRLTHLDDFVAALAGVTTADIHETRVQAITDRELVPRRTMKAEWDSIRKV